MKKKILLVDDSVPILTLLSSLFGTKHEVYHKNSAISALDWLQEGNLPNLIISDINMPDLNGHEFITQLKSSGFFNQIPILVLSGNQSVADKVKLLKLGVEDYVIKPFNPEELFIRAENLLKRSDKALQVA